MLTKTTRVAVRCVMACCRARLSVLATVRVPDCSAVAFVKLVTAGTPIARMIPMMAITVSNSISVKARLLEICDVIASTGVNVALSAARPIANNDGDGVGVIVVLDAKVVVVVELDAIDSAPRI